MQVIPTRIHGLLDYAVGILVVASPWLFNFSDGGAQTWIPVVLGLGVLGYSLATRYEFGLVKLIPMPIHLILDAGGGLFLAVSPWLFGFSDRVWIPFVVIGVFEIAAAALTHWEPSRDPQQPNRQAPA